MYNKEGKISWVLIIIGFIPIHYLINIAIEGIGFKVLYVYSERYWSDYWWVAFTGSLPSYIVFIFLLRKYSIYKLSESISLGFQRLLVALCLPAHFFLNYLFDSIGITNAFDYFPVVDDWFKYFQATILSTITYFLFCLLGIWVYNGFQAKKG